MSADTAAAGTPYGTIPPASPLPQRKPISLPRLAQLRAAGVETILVGDSLGMVCQGLPSTVGVSLETMAYHTASVARGLRRAQGTAWVVADLPYGSYQESAEQAMRSATVLMQAGAHMVKLEGGGWTAPIVRFLVERGIPVCAHLGLTPQTVHALGGYRVQGRGDEGAAQLRRHALQLQDMGASMLVLEMVPAELSARLTEELTHCHTIGIGAGNGTAGQVLVLHDMLGMNLGKMPKFVRNFMQETGSIKEAMAAYVRAVKDGSFPDNTLHAW